MAQSLISPTCVPPLPPGKPLRLGVMASGSGSNFEAIVAAIAAQRLHAQVRVMICNNPKARVFERADRWHIPAVLHNHRQVPSREALDTQIVQTLHDHQVECVIMAGWMRIVTPVLIHAFPNAILNIHPSLLPSFKGIHAVEQALAAGVKIAGCTVHRVVPAVDSGEILAQAAVPVMPEDTPETLQARIHLQEHRIYPQAIASIIPEFRPTPSA
ncbi:phosphoribosylglycinamide formyltransferase [Lyngbya confervoides]|uniref:Phosphoribosylglycinamide formyltransferase n=1 Tax=Lyngbya confervoides BDU141951 TaxID=1574623 RepID=A0ABD4SZZ9_9CYAN|nr:phosphoribosylglycinamide formyltransferase [Lyngbya confervoides]MCM1981642.1 phosphoribosylglycinamide formyltransferase [Lyngbya confervoides BDU141951]